MFPPASSRFAVIAFRQNPRSACAGLRDRHRPESLIVFTGIRTYRQEVLDAQTYNQTETFKTEMQQRPLIERIVFELTHCYGARGCLGRERQNADWQAKMAAVAYNLNLWMRKLTRTARSCRQGWTLSGDGKKAGKMPQKACATGKRGFPGGAGADKAAHPMKFLRSGAKKYPLGLAEALRPRILQHAQPIV
ncbi:MAG: hypothetical protein Fur0022_22740 [Anaerolineales bacterium]